MKNLEKRVALGPKNRSKKRTEEEKTISKPPEEFCDQLIFPAHLTEVYFKICLNNLQIEMLEINYVLFKRKKSVHHCHEGWDAAGKEGISRALPVTLILLGYNVVPWTPNDYEEK